VLIVGFLYTLVSFSVLKFNIFGDENLNFQSLILIFDTIIPFYGKIILSIVGFLICLIAVNLYVASTTRLLYSYTKNHLTYNINLILIVFCITTTVSLKILYNIKIDTLILYANGVFVLIYFFVGLSGIKLLNKIDKFVSILATFILGIVIVIIGFDMIYAIGIFLLFFVQYRNKIIL
jgi:amino acid efflux transporter